MSRITVYFIAISIRINNTLLPSYSLELTGQNLHTVTLRPLGYCVTTEEPLVR